MPSRSTVQAPQCVVSQPIWVPVMPEVFADEMHQQRARFDEAFDLGAVHLHGDMGFCHLFLP